MIISGTVKPENGRYGMYLSFTLKIDFNEKELEALKGIIKGGSE